MTTPANPDDHAGVKQSNTAAYVREMLQLNPIWHAPQIIARRREFLLAESNFKCSANSPDGAGINPRIASTTSLAAATSLTADLAPADERLILQAAEALTRLQTQFYSLSDAKLRRCLTIIGNPRLPQYAGTAARLTRIAELRPLLQLVASKTGDRKFAYSLLSSLVSPAAESGLVLEQYIDSIIEEKRVDAALIMIRRFVNNHPQLYRLQEAWFDTLLDPRNAARWKANPIPFKEPRISGWLPGPLGLFAMFVVMMGFHLMRSSVQRQPESSPKTFQVEKYIDRINQQNGRGGELSGASGNPGLGTSDLDTSDLDKLFESLAAPRSGADIPTDVPVMDRNFLDAMDSPRSEQWVAPEGSIGSPPPPGGRPE